MPTYEYECTSCHRRYEVVQRFSDPPLETCEVCGGKLKRVYHPVGVVLKGSGFYSTDTRSRKALTPGTKEDGSDKKSSEATKPAEKKDTKKPAATKDSGGGSGSNASS
ncbi:MAG: FmdB family zinc ribbon protein [Actinomycetota bacterium]